MPQTELTLPLSQTMRAAMCVRESSDSGGSDIVMATFDMPEDFLFSDFDISGLRGWQSPPSALILPSSASKPDVTLLPRAAESSQSLNPFSLNLEIPDTKLTQKTASSVLISMRVSASHVTELSRTHLPILMPDLLTVNTVCHELLASNHSIGAILSLHYDPTSFEIAPVPHQTLRLEPRHFALGMDMDLDAREARLVVLSATRSKAVKAREGVTGFSPRMETEVDLKVVTYCEVLPLREEGMPDALSCTGKVEGTNLQYFTLLEGSRVTEEDEHDEDSDEERLSARLQVSL
ncbi:hypothetical protein BC830DRAFT_912470 [Chytriomyces sp. MP71]|nr:hypothetical protein BC830DRAFT_912470 [Chytriomyces sp. MP71]